MRTTKNMNMQHPKRNRAVHRHRDASQHLHEHEVAKTVFTGAGIFVSVATVLAGIAILAG